jgi:tripartite-type tricarboxylate transporter receptor subunit TctC
MIRSSKMRTIPTVTLAFTTMAFGLMGIADLAACADVWPQRNVRIITPFPSGTGGDISARSFAEKLAQRWGRPVVVENKPGADGILAVGAFVGANDDHTLLFTNGGPFTSNPFSHDKLPYDAVRDAVAISSASDAVISLAVPASLNIASLGELVKFAAGQPGKLNWSATPGALDYIVPGFLNAAGLDMTHVAYREIAPALQDLAEGRIQLYVSALATQLPFVQAGKARVLAVTNRERSTLLPSIPTAAEAGFPNLTFDAFLGFFGPQSMSAELRERISADGRAVGADPAVAARLAAVGLIIRTNTPADLSAIVERERNAVATVARNAPSGQKR